MSEHVERLTAWFEEPHEPIQLLLDRPSLFTVMVALRLSRNTPGMDEAMLEIVNTTIEGIESLLPADLAYMAMFPTGRRHQVRLVCFDCGRPLIGPESVKLGRCEICLEDSGT